MKKLNIKYILLAIFSLISIIFVYNDHFIYEKPILKVTSLKTTCEEEIPHEENYYHQEITGVIMNGKYKGSVLSTTNDYSTSLIYDDKIVPNSELFVELSSNGKSILNIDSIKRDKYLVILIVIFVDLIIVIAGKKGLKTLLSLVINLGLTAGAIIIYMNHYLKISMLPLYLLVSILFIVISLFITNGKSKKTLAAIISSIVSLLISFGVSFLIIKLNEQSLYIWIMEYIEAVNDYYGYLYVSVLLCGLGAIMDISITIASALSELIRKDEHINRVTLYKSGREISKDIVGTMINVMLFTCYTSVIPTIVIALNNNMSFFNALNFYGGLELSIVLCTCIGIVLTIPISLFLSIHILSPKKKGVVIDE